MDSLLAIATKAPIVSTFGVEALREAPAHVRDTYDWHAASYVEPPPIADLRRAFIDAVLAERTPKASLVAPFGYGKTASAIGMWRSCQAAHLLTIPPVSCSSFTEIARAITEWLGFVLPGARDDICAAHDRFLAGSAEALARRDERQFGIPFDQGLVAITDKLERGYLDFDDVSINLIAYLEGATNLARRAGYAGLVIIVDEMQQLLGNASKGVLVALRQLIWGLRTRQLPLGLLLTMDPDTERTLADRAGDILHRIKDDGLFLDIRSIYDRNFPAQLWRQYIEAFALSDAARVAIDGNALEALGQLCERDDLSNGPRTVINVLQVAVTKWEERCTSYTPIDLVEDFLNGTVRFDGDRGVLPALVSELLNYPYFQRSVERASALKLLAAFPRGCPVQVAASYSLEDAWHELSDDLRGEIVTDLDEGLALIELQHVGRPANRLNVLLRRYWMQITDEQLFAEDAPQAFASLVLPLLFPPRVHDLSGWTGVRDVALTATGGYAGILEGTFSASYPLRRLAVAVITADQDVPTVRGQTDTDFRLVFRLDLDAHARSDLVVSDTGDIQITLALGRTAPDGLPGGLSWIEHYLSPQPISAAVILSLLRYFEHQDRGDQTARDRARIDDTIARLRSWLLGELLPQDLFQVNGFDVIQAGYGGMQELLHLCSSKRWPAYDTLLVHQHWTALMDDYVTALTQSSPAARVGLTPIRATKSDVAALFGQARHAGFESRARQYGDLLQLDIWRADEAVIRFVPHPTELRLVSELRDSGSLLATAAYGRLRGLGYSSLEAELLLRLIQTRGLAVEKNGVLETPGVPAGVELLARIRDLRERCAGLAEAPQEFRERLAILAQEADADTIADPVEAAWQLERIEQWLTRAEADRQAAIKARSESARSSLIESMSQLAPLPHATTVGELTNHLVALRRLTEEERQRLQHAAEDLTSSQEPCPPDDADALTANIVEWQRRALLVERWMRLAHGLTAIQTACKRLGSSGVVGDLEGQANQLTDRARAILSQVGIPALGEIGRFEVALTSLQQDFTAAEAARSTAYRRIATELRSQVGALLDLPPSVVLPTYDPSDDEQSFVSLHRVVAAATSRSIALLGLRILMTGGSAQEKLARAKLRSDIRDLARRAADPAWLFVDSTHQLKSNAVKSIEAIRRRVDREIAQSSLQRSFTSPHLIKALSALPAGAVDVSSLLQHVKGTISRADLLDELMRLHEAGAIRMVIDIHADAEQP